MSKRYTLGVFLFAIILTFSTITPVFAETILQAKLVPSSNYAKSEIKKLEEGNYEIFVLSTAPAKQWLKYSLYRYRPVSIKEKGVMELPMIIKEDFIGSDDTQTVQIPLAGGKYQIALHQEEQGGSGEMELRS